MTSPLRTLPEAIQRLKPLDRVADPVSKAVADVLPPGRVKDALAGTWLGHPTHPVLTDVTLGAWTSAFVLDAVGGERTEAAADMLVGLGVLSSLPTALTGVADWVDTWGPTRRVGTVHAIGNLVAAGVYAVSWVARKRGARGLGVALGVLGAGIASGTAYLGGHLVYGKGVGVDESVFEHGPRRWTAVAAEADVPAEGAGGLAVKAGDAEIALFRQGGWVCAIGERCTHRGGPLHKGEVRDGRVVCPWHGSEFDVCSGGIVRGPATAPQPAYETRVQDGTVEVRTAH
jgi:nitrite reductase/ring-hydroxylating ferredoxin subunit